MTSGPPLFLKRKTTLKGDTDDPLQNTIKYITAIEKKFAVDDAMAIIKQDYRDNPFSPDQPKLAKFAKDKIDEFQGKYSFADAELDNIRNRMSDWLDKNTVVPQKITDFLRGEPFLMTRFANTYMGWTSNLTMGYAPIKAAVNRYGGVMHQIIQEGLPSYLEGRKALKDPKFRAFVEGQGYKFGHGINMTSNESMMDAHWYKPLYLHQKAEWFNREEAFAGAYLKAMKDPLLKRPGMTDTQLSEAATEIAVKSVELSQGIYAAVARPGLIKGPIPKMSFQFKQYMVNEQRFLAQLTPQQWALYVPYIVAAGGTRGAIITTKSILALAGLGKALDEVNAYMNENYPKAHRGIPGLVGMDLSAATTWQLPGSAREFLGKPLSDLQAMAIALKKKLGPGLTDPEVDDLVRQIAPTAHSIYKGLQIVKDGQISKGSHTKQVFSEGDKSAAAFVHFMGTRPVVESVDSDKLQRVNEMTMAVRERQRVLFDDLADASPMQQSAIIAQMQKEKLLGQHPATQIRNALRSRQLPQLMQAIKKMPYQQRGAYINSFIANSQQE